MAFISNVKAVLGMATKTQTARLGVFDIDDILVDCRHRTLAVGMKFDREHGTHFFEGKNQNDMLREPDKTAESLGMSSEQASRFVTFWKKHFFDGKNFRHDRPMEDTISLAQNLAKEGWAIRYLTGRTQSELKYTLRQLTEFGLPQVKRSNVVHKPKVKLNTVEYKLKQLQEWKNQFADVFFITESRKEILAVVDANLPIQTLLMQSKASGDEAVRPSTHVFSFTEYDLGERFSSHAHLLVEHGLKKTK